MKKINIVGTSGSGKSTFARELAAKLAYPCIEMDALFWGPNWYESTDEEFFKKLTRALQAESWVLDGNYTRTTSIKWAEVDTVIWIDFSFARTLFQAIRRALSRIISQQELWPGTGNRESLARLFSRDSIVWWTIKTYHSKQKRYLQAMKNPEFSHIRFIRLRSPHACKEFIRKIS